MKTKNKIMLAIMVVLMGIFFTLIGVNKLGENPSRVYQVYLDGKKVGLVEDKEELLNLINEEQQEIKDTYQINQVYPPTGFDILESITFDISKGNKVIILGDSGSGKSTILKLLLKYYEINRNMIYLNGIDLNNYSISDVRNSIGLMSQNEILYTDTILNNITLYQEIDSNKWLDICKITYVDDFVKKFFLGYQTKLEENGLNLSGGQRQRLLLARLLLQEKEVIIIDEGLNALDVNLERKILKNIFYEVDHN